MSEIPKVPSPTNEEKAAAWDEFLESGMLWFVNRILHVFGWNIVLPYSSGTKKFLGAYPKRTTDIGFPLDMEIDKRDDMIRAVVRDHMEKNMVDIEAAAEMERPHPHLLFGDDT